MQYKLSTQRLPIIQRTLHKGFNNKLLKIILQRSNWVLSLQNIWRTTRHISPANYGNTLSTVAIHPSYKNIHSLSFKSTSHLADTRHNSTAKRRKKEKIPFSIFKSLVKWMLPETAIIYQYKNNNSRKTNIIEKMTVRLFDSYIMFEEGRATLSISTYHVFRHMKNTKFVFLLIKKILLIIFHKQKHCRPCLNKQLNIGCGKCYQLNNQ